MKPVPESIRRDTIAGILPWAIYGIGSTLKLQALGALAAAGALLLLRIPFWREIKLYDISIFCFFTTVFIGYQSKEHPWIQIYKPAIAPLIFTSMILLTSLCGKPYTLQYARQFAQPIWWKNPHFIRVNHILSAFWCGSFALITLLSFSMIQTGTPSSVLLTVISLLLTGASILFTRRFPLWYRLHHYLPLVRAGKEPYYPAPRL